MKKQVFLLLLASLCFWTCRKDQKTIVKGTVVAFGTEKPIAGATVWLLCYSGSFLGGNSSTDYDSIITDTNGAFYREYNSEDICGGAYAVVTADNYYKKDGIGVLINNTTDVKVELSPHAWFKVVTIPSGIGVGNIGFGGNFLGAAGVDTNNLNGTEEFLFPTSGNRDIYIYKVKVGTGALIGEETIFLPAHDTLTYTIHY